MSIPLFAQSSQANLPQQPFYLSAAFVLATIFFLCVFVFILWKRQQKINRLREQKIAEAITTLKESLTTTIEDQPKSPITHQTNKTDQKIVRSADEKWLKLLEQNANQLIDDGKFSIIELAESMNLSERQFRRKFKQNTNMTPATYLREIRLSKALFLLENKMLPTVSEVCHVVGFSTPKHFSKLFQERFGKKPSSYLEKNKNSKRP